MHKNPFSPSFSIRPERFYGRARELSLVEQAIENPDSPDRFLFVTGTRGCGKTSLLHQFAQIAKRHRWTILETTYQDALSTLRTYAKADASSGRTTSLSPSVGAAGVSASLFEVTRTTTQAVTPHLAEPFVGELSRARLSNGTFVTIDEVQKIPKRDMEEICHAVQAARTRGLDVALVIAGLPAAYRKVRAFRGCTFIQRMRRCRLGMLNVVETIGLLESMFALVPEIALTDAQIRELAQFSAGHPYLLQLLGSATYDVATETTSHHQAGDIALDDAALRETERRALADYQGNVLHTLLSDTSGGTKAYVRAMCEVCDETSTASTAEIAHALDKTLQECSPARARVIDLQLADPIARGRLRFALPYLPLAFEEPDDDATFDPASTWAPRKLPFA